MAITKQDGPRYVGHRNGEYFVNRVFRYTVRPDGEYIFVHGTKAEAEVFCEHNVGFLLEYGYTLEMVANA